MDLELLKYKAYNKRSIHLPFHMLFSLELFDFHWSFLLLFHLRNIHFFKNDKKKNLLNFGL
ncbi:abhydrolase domain-containing protein 4 (S33 family) [Schistosoma mansoni]|uniref:abhydrolase domain-containing protein 4 (S33 family) n=1 Tax=Schistosoma mansoni TaxID=6183 RepID=UPI00022DC355|nr:abhydrolase domain-containing protein 4 (S33 family) [Schistosoma mansoni]|eukprot:XP_018650970.1 abhydrolase domain-containing protein 4 (S33 family) [Schistosoma mansoni]